MKQVQDRSRARSKSAGRSASRAPEWKKDRETEKTVESIYLPTEEDAKTNQEWKEPPQDWNEWKQYKIDINKKLLLEIAEDHPQPEEVKEIISKICD